MKKIMFFAAMLAMSMVSCGNKTDGATSAADTDTVVVDSVDSVAVDSVVAE